MTPENRLLVLQWIREHRQFDGQDSYYIDADEFEDWLLDRPSEPVELEPSPTFEMIEVPVIDGVATLPDGTTVKSTANVVRVPVLTSKTDEAPA